MISNRKKKLYFKEGFVMNKLKKEKNRGFVLIMIVFLVLVFVIISCELAPRIGGDINKNKLADGVYEGSYESGLNSADVEVTINDKKILKIIIVKHSCSPIGKKAEAVIDRIIHEQATKVDAITGATNSSHVIMNAIHKAVEKSYGE